MNKYQVDACTVQETKIKDAEDFKLLGGGTLYVHLFTKGQRWWVPRSWYFYWPASVIILEGHIETLHPSGIPPNKTNHINPFTLHTHESKAPDHHEIEEHYLLQLSFRLG